MISEFAARQPSYRPQQGAGHEAVRHHLHEGVNLVIMRGRSGGDRGGHPQGARGQSCDCGGRHHDGPGRAAVSPPAPIRDILNNAAARRRAHFVNGTPRSSQGARRKHDHADPPIRAVVGKTIARKFGRIINITSGAVKFPIPELGLSNGARTALLRRAVAKTVLHNVTINAVLPGPFDNLPPTSSTTQKSPARPRTSCAPRAWPRARARRFARSRNSASAARRWLHHRPEPAARPGGAHPGHVSAETNPGRKEIPTSAVAIEPSPLVAAPMTGSTWR